MADGWASPSRGLSASLRELGFRIGRLKTGTPCRIDGRTIDLGSLERQPGDVPLPVFCEDGPPPPLPQLPCYITATTARTHEIILQNLHRSPLLLAASPVSDRAIARRLKTRSFASPTSRGTKSSSNPRGWTPLSTTPTASRPRCPPTCRSRWCAASRVLSGRASALWLRRRVRLLRPTQLQPTLEARHVAGCTWPADQRHLRL